MGGNGVLAQAPIETNNNIPTLRGLEGVFENAVSALLALAGVALFIMLIVGGFNYLTSGGDPKKLEAARSTLTYAIGGIILVSLSFLILRFIQVFTGADVTNFRIYIP